MMAWVAVLSCASAVELDIERTTDSSKTKWTISQYAIDYIKATDQDNNIGFRGALRKCINSNGEAPICNSLEETVLRHMRLTDV